MDKPLWIQESDASRTDNRFMTLNQLMQKTCYLDIYIILLLTFLHVPVHKGPSSEKQTRVTQHKTNLVTFGHR